MNNGHSFKHVLDLEEKAELFLSLSNLRKRLSALEQEIKQIKEYLVFTDYDETNTA
tara:strand:+ start:294 stop:461 length:168 start_codon:yes stop_codon:yes gene_type:complete